MEHRPFGKNKKDLNVEGVEFNQGKLRGLIKVMTVRELLETMETREGHQFSLFSDTNRPINPGHVDKIAKYIETCENWALPAFALAVNRKISLNNRSRLTTFKEGEVSILDGQHRLEALKSVNAKYERAERQDLSNDLMERQMAVVLYIIEKPEDQRQLYADFSQQRANSAAEHAYMDQRNGLRNIVREVCEKHPLFRNGRFLTTDRNVKKGENRLATLLNMEAVCRAMELGLGKSMGAAKYAEYAVDPGKSALQNKFEDFLDFLSQWLPEYKVLIEDSELNLASKREETYAYDPQILVLWAAIYGIETGAEGNTEKLHILKPEINLEKKDPENSIDHGLGLRDGKKYKKIKDQAWNDAISTLRRYARDNAEC